MSENIETSQIVAFYERQLTYPPTDEFSYLCLKAMLKKLRRLEKIELAITAPLLERFYD